MAENRTDLNSPAELTFLETLYKGGYRLPDGSQSHPCADVAVQPDFYYEKETQLGVCVFIDGSQHDEPAQMAHDKEVNEQLGNKGFRVIRIRADKDMETQIRENQDIFGQGSGL